MDSATTNKFPTKKKNFFSTHAHDGYRISLDEQEKKMINSAGQVHYTLLSLFSMILLMNLSSDRSEEENCTHIIISHVTVELYISFLCLLLSSVKEREREREKKNE